METVVTVLEDTEVHIYRGDLQEPTLVIQTESGLVTFQASAMDDDSGLCVLADFAYYLADIADQWGTLAREMCPAPDHDHVRPDYGPNPNDDDDADSGPACADSDDDEPDPPNDEVGAEALDAADDDGDSAPDGMDAVKGDADPVAVDEERPGSAQ